QPLRRSVHLSGKSHPFPPAPMFVRYACRLLAPLLAVATMSCAPSYLLGVQPAQPHTLFASDQPAAEAAADSVALRLCTRGLCLRSRARGGRAATHPAHSARRARARGRGSGHSAPALASAAARPAGRARPRAADSAAARWGQPRGSQGQPNRLVRRPAERVCAAARRVAARPAGARLRVPAPLRPRRWPGGAGARGPAASGAQLCAVAPAAIAC
nr:hypothetical protein [Tanacetum cinerariifolium]